MEERTGNDALSKQTAFSVFPPLADGRNTAGKQLFKIGSVSAVCQFIKLKYSEYLQFHIPCR